MSAPPTDTPTTKSFNAEAFALNLARAMENGGKALTAFLQPRETGDAVDAALGGALFAFLRHDAAGMRAVLERDGQHLVGGGHFQIERNAQVALERGDIRVARMRDLLPGGFELEPLKERTASKPGKA